MFYKKNTVLLTSHTILLHFYTVNVDFTFRVFADDVGRVVVKF